MNYQQVRQEEIWPRILTRLREQVEPRSFDTWLRPTRQASWNSSDLTLAVPNRVFAEWIHRNFLNEILAVLNDFGHPGARIHFRVSESEEANPAPSYAPPLKRGNGERGMPVRPTPAVSPLNPKYTFENFVVSSCNQFAHAASTAVTDQPALHYNPLYIYGGVGLGKTHLMQAIGNRLRSTREDLKLRYISSEKFMNELINAIRFEKTIDFKKRYRDIDILLVDDIQFLAGKERTQEEFFHTFNELYDAQKQIVISSDCHPREIPTLEERLRSRFEWGLIADIQPPDLETKVAILRKKAETHRVSLPQEVGLYIAGRTGSNIRELEGSLLRLLAFASMTGRSIDLPLAQEALSELLKTDPPMVTVEAIQRMVADHFKVRVFDLKSKNNRPQIVLPRQVAMFLCKNLTEFSLPTIGGFFGGKHHSTVIHAIRKVEVRMQDNPDFRRLIDSLTQGLK
ncbi:MAG: chromosomal replication initiator protein DnaA [Acidobacteria bacterium]|nr:chromosomal replication initiator protein DnaA [Acidobacteriota bacterium]